MSGQGAAAGETELPGLAEFNALDGESARQALMACCSSPHWAGAVLAGRPYRSAAALLRQSDEAVAGLTSGGLRSALAGHPQIGARHGEARDGARAGAGGEHGGGASDDGRAGDGGDGGRTRGAGGWSRQEQAGVAGAAELTRQELAEGNAAYERRFGHIYLVCATGRSAEELLAALRERLSNDSDAEWRVVRSELAKINRIRLLKLIGGAA